MFAARIFINNFFINGISVAIAILSNLCNASIPTFLNYVATVFQQPLFYCLHILFCIFILNSIIIFKQRNRLSFIFRHISMARIYFIAVLIKLGRGKKKCLWICYYSIYSIGIFFYAKPYFKNMPKHQLTYANLHHYRIA